MNKYLEKIAEQVERSNTPVVAGALAGGVTGGVIGRRVAEKEFADRTGRRFTQAFYSVDKRFDRENPRNIAKGGFGATQAFDRGMDTQNKILALQSKGKVRARNIGRGIGAAAGLLAGAGAVNAWQKRDK